MAFDDRRIVFGTHVIPQEAADMGEPPRQKWSILREDTSGDAVAKTLGGKGICTDLADNQWSDSWTSMAHPQKYWEDWKNVHSTEGNQWEDVTEYWSGVAKISISPVAISNSGNDLAFFYLKNLESSQVDVNISVDGGHTNYIKVPPGGSVYFRGGHADFNCDEVRLNGQGYHVFVEYIIASK